MDKRKIKTVKKVAISVLCIIVIFIALINVFAIKNDDFWKTSATTCITLLVAIVFGYYMTQKNLDARRQKDEYIKIIEKIQAIIMNDLMYNIIDNNNINEALMNKRNLSNYITILKNHASKFGFKTEVAFINEKFEEYADILGNHNDDLEYLKKSQMELKRPLELIEGKLDEMTIRIYD